MSEIKDCLPKDAVPHFITLRNIRDESETKNYQQRLVESRREAAARGQIASGPQLAREWQIMRESQETRAIGYVEATLETCKLYEIPLTPQLCDCLLQAVHELLVVQHKHAVQTIALRVSSINAPSSVRSHFENDPIAFPVLNRIRATVEKARVEDNKARLAIPKDNPPAADTRTEIQSNEEVVMHSPNFYGIGVNLRSLWRRISSRKKRE